MIDGNKKTKHKEPIVTDRFSNYSTLQQVKIINENIDIYYPTKIKQNIPFRKSTDIQFEKEN